MKMKLPAGEGQTAAGRQAAVRGAAVPGELPPRSGLGAGGGSGAPDRLIEGRSLYPR